MSNKTKLVVPWASKTAWQQDMAFSLFSFKVFALIFQTLNWVWPSLIFFKQGKFWKGHHFGNMLAFDTYLVLNVQCAIFVNFSFKLILVEWNNKKCIFHFSFFFLFGTNIVIRGWIVIYLPVLNVEVSCHSWKWLSVAVGATFFSFFFYKILGKNCVPGFKVHNICNNYK